MYKFLPSFLLFFSVQTNQATFARERGDGSRRHPDPAMAAFLARPALWRAAGLRGAAGARAASTAATLDAGEHAQAFTHIARRRALEDRVVHARQPATGLDVYGVFGRCAAAARARVPGRNLPDLAAQDAMMKGARVLRASDNGGLTHGCRRLPGDGDGTGGVAGRAWLQWQLQQHTRARAVVVGHDGVPARRVASGLIAWVCFFFACCYGAVARCCCCKQCHRTVFS